MRGIGKNSGKTPCLDTETDPLLLVSLRLKKGYRIKQSKEHESKPKSNLKSNLLKRKGSTTGRKLVGKAALSWNQCDTDLSNKVVSVKLMGCEKNGKTANGDINRDKGKKRKRKRERKQKKINNVQLDEASRLQRRTRYLLIKMKLEQNLIDAYSAEGWKGQSREKIRPETELRRAKMQIIKCKLAIRDALRQLHLLSSVGSIEDSVMPPDGSVYHEHIFCAKCKSREAFPDNDIILCDGTCNSAFHQKCLDPPLDTESIPPGEQGWFCRFCDCRTAILDSLNAHLGTDFTMNNSWEDVFKEEAAFPEGGNALLNSDEEWPSDDSEDVDYDPDGREHSSSIGVAGTDDDASEEVSSNCSVGSDDSTDVKIICGRRRRRDVDYRKLYDEMFGKDAPLHEQISDDEDWDPTKRKRREKESDAASTLMTLHDSDKKDSTDISEFTTKGSLDTQLRRSFFRIPHSAVERLRELFAENELPSRDVKENISKELGLDSEKVSKWFKNARYLALKTRKAESEKHVNATPVISNESKCLVKKENDHLMSKNAPKEAEFKVTMNMKKSSERLCMKSINPLKKCRGETSSSSNVYWNKTSMDSSDDVILKKLLDDRAKAKARVNFIGGNRHEDAEAKMERLCRAKNKLEILKQRLLRFQKGKANNSNKASLNEKYVIYVPVAEVREKL